MSTATHTPLASAFNAVRRWKWVECRMHSDGWCCHAYEGPYPSEFMGCRADMHNDWVAARFWRRWSANIRAALEALERREVA